MADGALHVKTSRDLLAKLKHEVSQFTDNPKNGYAILNAVRDGYHLREWVWHEYVEGKCDTQKELAIKNKDGFNELINTMFTDFPIIKELCNGSKHMKLYKEPKITDSSFRGYGTQPYGKSSFGVGGFYVEMADGSSVDVNELVEKLLVFWEKFFTDQGWQ